MQNRRRHRRAPLRSLLRRRNPRRRLRRHPPITTPRRPPLALPHHLPRGLEPCQSPRTTNRKGRLRPVQLPPDRRVCSVLAAEFHTVRRSAAVLGVDGEEGGAAPALEVF